MGKYKKIDWSYNSDHKIKFGKEMVIFKQLPKLNVTAWKPYADIKSKAMKMTWFFTPTQSNMKHQVNYSTLLNLIVATFFTVCSSAVSSSLISYYKKVHQCCKFSSES